MKQKLLVAVLFCFSCVCSITQASEQSVSTQSQYLLTGGGYINQNWGMPLLLGISWPLIAHTIYIESHGGTMFSRRNPPVLLSAQARWDFLQSHRWSSFILGGLGMSYHQEEDQAKGEFDYFPRYGLGAMVRAASQLWIRVEISPQWSLLSLTHGF